MERLAGLQVHTGDGFAKFPFSEAFTRPEYESGGSGLFATPRAFLAVLGAVLAGGVSPRTGRRILKQETVDDMFVPQTLDVPDQGALATGELAAAMPTHTRRIPLLPGRKAWTLSHLTNLEQMPNGKSAGAGEWYGLANLYWTIDRRAGVAALAFSQTLPFGRRSPCWKEGADAQCPSSSTPRTACRRSSSRRGRWSIRRLRRSRGCAADRGREARMHHRCRDIDIGQFLIAQPFPQSSFTSSQQFLAAGTGLACTLD